MADPRHGTDPAPNAKHEQSDANAVGMMKIGVGLLLLILGVLGVAYAILRLLEANPPAPTTQPSALADQQALPPEPRLQVDPPVDLMKYRQWEDSVLTTYAWVDRGRGTVRIPVESAIVMVAQKGLPLDPAAVAELRKDRAEYGGSPGADSLKQAAARPLEPETSARPGTTAGRGTPEISPKAAHGPGGNREAKGK